jgi:phosphoglycerate kinase
VDINSPVDPEAKKVLSLTRIKSHVDTIQKLKDSKLVLLAHQSKPGKADYISLKAHAASLRTVLKRPVKFVDDLIGQKAKKAVERLNAGEIILLENTRFFAEEVVLNKSPVGTQGKSHIVQNLAPLSDYFVNDAFAAAHRAQPSLIGFTETLPSAAGSLMEKELTALNKVLDSDHHPCVAVLGGAKVQDSLEVAENMLNNKIADKILTTGVVANLLLVAEGKKLGKANMDFLESEFNNFNELVDSSKKLLKKFDKKIELPIDLIGNNKGERDVVYVDKLPTKYPIYDIGLETIVKYTNEIKDAKIIIANGPAGVFEIEEFSFGTNEIFFAIANSKGYSVVGGGETTAAIDKLGISGDFDHISTGGGACINYLAGHKLPVIDALKKSKKLFEKSI